MNLTRVKIFCFLALCLSFVVSCRGGSSTPAASLPTVNVVANKTVDGPFADGVSRLFGEVAPYNGNNAVSMFDLILMDGDYNTPEEMNQETALLKTLLSAGKPVLLVDVKNEHKIQALTSTLGISIPGDTMALFIYRPPSNGEGGWIYEFTPGFTDNEVPESSVDTYLADIKTFLASGHQTMPARQNVQMVDSQSIPLLNEGGVDDCSLNPAQVKCMPEGLKSYKFDTYTVRVDYGVQGKYLDPIMASGTPLGYWGNMNDFLDKSVVKLLKDLYKGFQEGRGYYFAGMEKDAQVPSYTLNFDVMLFADTKQTTFKYVYIETSGSYSPGTMVNDDWWGGRLWFQDFIDLSYKLTDADGSLTDIIWKASNPQSRNDEKKVTDTTSFDIGFTAGAKGGKEGGTKGEISGSYSFEHSEERNIQDWNLIATSESARNKSGWQFYQESPWSPIQWEFPLPWYVGWYAGIPKEIPNLSKGELQIHTQSVYQAVKSAVNKVLRLDVRASQWYEALHNWGGGVNWSNRVKTDPNEFSFNIDLSKLDTKDFYSTEFYSGGNIPTKYSATDPDFPGAWSLPFKWRDIPAEAKSLALIMESTPNVANWVVFNIQPGANGIGALPDGASLDPVKLGSRTIEGRNKGNSVGWIGPESGSYTIKFYALDVDTLKLDNAPLDNAATAIQVRAAMSGHIISGFPLEWKGIVR